MKKLFRGTSNGNWMSGKMNADLHLLGICNGFSAFPVIFILLFAAGVASAQTTYTWNLPGSGSWATSGNWTPARTVPAATDILVFNNGATLTVSDVPTQTIGRLIVSGNTNVTLSTTGVGVRTLRMSNAGTALDIQNGSALALTGNSGSGNRTLTLAFMSGANIAAIAGTLTLDIAGPGDSGQFNAANGTTTVTGTIVQNGGSINSSTANLIFASGSAYIHAMNGGAVPTASWNTNSNCTITGMTTAYPNGMGQTFGNVTFASALTFNVNMSGGLTCAGNLTFSNANTGNNLRLVRTGVNRTISVAGNYTHTSGNLSIVSANGNGTLNVSGNFIQTGGLFILKEDNGDGLLNVAGDFIKSGGTFIQRTSGGSTADVVVAGNFSHSSGIYYLSSQDNDIGTLSIAGNFSVTGGTITENGGGAAAGDIFFNGPGTPQVYTPGGTISQNINFTVNTGAVLQLGTAHLIGSSGNFTLDGTLMMDIGGNSPVDYGQVSVGGTASVTGTVAPTFTFTPAVNDNFLVIIPTGGHSGIPALTITPGSITGVYTSGVVTITGLFPIDLVYFTGKAASKTIVLTWQTRQEENNDYMAVERSLNGRDFEEIGRVAGSGSGYILKAYTLTDEHPGRGLNYYRLRQVDFDGKTVRYPVISILFGGRPAELNPIIFPNPVSDDLNLTWTDQGQLPVRITLFDLTGKQQGEYVAPAGSEAATLPAGHLLPGMYILQVNQGQGRAAVKFRKQ